MNGGEIIAKVLQKQEVKFLFTLCGGHISPIFVSAQRQGIRVVDTRHEANAVFAADAVSRLTGIPGVAAVTAGPGVTNTITAVKNAYLAQSPLVLLGGAAATILKGRGSLQDIDQMSLMRPNVKWAVSISKVKDIVPVLNKAFRVAQEGIPGPVFVECPIDILYDEALVREWYGAKSKEVPPKNFKERIIQWYINRHAKKIFQDKDRVDIHQPLTSAVYPKHNYKHLEKVLVSLRAAKQPLLVLGSGAVMNARKVADLAQAVERLNIPVYLSGMARGLLGKDHPLQLRHKRREAIKRSDLIILLGVPNDFRLDYGNQIGQRQFISVNRSKTDLYKNKKPGIAVHADPLEFLVDLSSKFKGSYATWMEQLKENDSLREKEIDQQAAQVLNGINPVSLFRELDQFLGDEVILVADGGDFVATASYILKPRKPLSWLDPGVFGTLGVGAGFALGAKLVFPEKEIWIIYGDGSAGYSLVEYDTFIRHKLPVNALIGNDAGWTQIARDQVDLLKSDCAVTLAHSDYEKIGYAFGAKGRRVENSEDLKKAIIEAREANKDKISYIINAIIGRSDFRKGSMSM
jgi:thiamine pyrophosphate-dependent acetolactate synthase large subunit-like protein